MTVDAFEARREGRRKRERYDVLADIASKMHGHSVTIDELEDFITNLAKEPEEVEEVMSRRQKRRSEQKRLEALRLASQRRKEEKAEREKATKSKKTTRTKSRKVSKQTDGQPEQSSESEPTE